MRRRVFRRLSNILLNAALLVIVAVLLVFTVALVRHKLLQNAQEMGMSLVRSYVVEEELITKFLKANLVLAGEYVDEIVTEGGNSQQVQEWLLDYFNKLSDTIGEGTVDFYSVIEGKIVAANPWEGDLDYPYEQTQWYQDAVAAGGEVVCGSVYTDAVTGDVIFTISRELSVPGDVLAMDVYVQNPALHITANTLPEGCSYYLCDQNGVLLYSVTPWGLSGEMAQDRLNHIMEGVLDDSLMPYDAIYVDPTGVQRGVYYEHMSNGWTVILTVPTLQILMGEANTMVYVVAGVALILFLILTFMTVQDFLRNRKMRISDDTAHMLGDSFYAIYRVNFKTGRYMAIKVHETLKGALPDSGDYTQLIAAMDPLVRSDTYRAFLTGFSLESIRERIAMGVADYGGDYQRRFGEEYRWVNVRTLYNPQVVKDEVILCFRDVDEEKRRELQHMIILQDALDASLRSTKAKSEFFSRMSHDMRTPLNAVLVCCDLARQSCQEGDQGKVSDYLKKISFAGNQLLALINDVLELSRIEAGKRDLEERKVNLRKLLADIVDLFQDKVREDGKTLEIQVDFRDDEIVGDEKKISQLVNNLLSNSIKYSNPGDRIRLEARQFHFQQHSKYQLVVEDTGIGMTPEFLEHLFDPYARETAFTSQAVTGTGLGMTIVKSLVQQMSGEISVESRLGQGTRFMVTLPLKTVEGQRQALQDEGEGEDLPDFSWEGRRILVAEDNDLNRELLTAVLQEFGAEVLPAEDGSQAVQLFLQQPPFSVDAILMDMQMPVMDGCQAAEAIRHSQRADAPLVPIIAVTANAFAEDIDRTTKAGMNGHISKPIDSRVLSRTVQKLIARRESLLDGNQEKE